MLFLQANGADGPPPPPEIPPESLWWLGVIWLLSMLFWLLSTGFWIWMLVHCWRNEPDRYFWIWILFIVPPASLVYFLVRYLPSGQLGTPGPLKRFARRREIDRLATAAQQIGNAHQWVQLGDALRESGQFERAGRAYDRALEKDAGNLQALWGAGLVALERGDHATARGRCARVLEIDPQYKFGDVSLTFGKALCGLRDYAAAEEHLTAHIRRWRHPEALYLLAELQNRRGDVDAARQMLHALLLDLEGSPRALARRHSRWKSKARKLLRKLPRGSEVV